MYSANFILELAIHHPDDASLIGELLQLCPSADDEDEEVPNRSLENLIKHVKVYTAADKYLINDLKEIAFKKINRTLRPYQLFACDHFYNFVEGFLRNTPDHLTDVRDTIVHRVGIEYATYGMQNHPALRTALANAPMLAYWVLDEQDDEPSNVTDIYNDINDISFSEDEEDDIR